MRRSKSLIPILGELVKLGMESQAVISQRCILVAKGGPPVVSECHRMVWEKVVAFGEVSAMLFWGADTKKVIRRYRKHVRSNKGRLSKRKR